MNDNSNVAVCALIGDLMASRDAPDQRELLADLTTALAWTNEHTSFTQKLEPTLGDEFQGVYAKPEEAIYASGLLSLALRDRCEVRYGFGVGSMMRDPDEGGYARQSGPAWWWAREAIETVESLQRSKGWPSSLRSRLRHEDPGRQGPLNAFLICRDQILAQMDGPDARIALALVGGERQVDVAEALGLGQPSVSARQRHGGAAAFVRAHRRLLADGTDA